MSDIRKEALGPITDWIGMSEQGKEFLINVPVKTCDRDCDNFTITTTARIGCDVESLAKAQGLTIEE